MAEIVYRGWLGLLVVALAAGSAEAAPPCDSLLPAETKLFVSVGDYPMALANWDKTGFGKLLNDPLMKPFSDDLDRQTSANKQRLGLTWYDLKQLAQGEVAWAYVHLKDDKPAWVQIIDVKGKADQAQAVLGRATKSLTDSGYKSRTVAQGNVTLTVLDPPAAKAANKDERLTTKVFFVDGDVLCAAESLAVATRILAALKGGSASATLHQIPAYTSVMQRCAKDAGPDQPDARWFLEPFGWTAAQRSEDPRLIPKKKPDPFVVYQKEGFTALQGVGGYVHLAYSGHDAVHRTLVFAPPPYKRAMQMLKLPNVGAAEFTPPAWVTQEMATCLVVSADLMTAFKHYGTLWDALYGDGEEGVFSDLVEGWALDPQGPQVKVEKDIIEKLKPKMVQTTAFQTPITATSERQVTAFETKPGLSVDKAINRLLDGEPTVKATKVNGVAAFEVYADDKRKPPPLSLVCVHQAALFSASHADVLARVIPPADGKPLASLPAYQAVDQALAKFGLTEFSLRQFGQTNRQVQAFYELFRAGKLEELKSNSMVSGIVQQMALEQTEQGDRKQAIDGSKLPEFEAVRRFFGPNGMLGVSEQDGWFLKGVVLAPGN